MSNFGKPPTPDKPIPNVGCLAAPLIGLLSILAVVLFFV